jgi:hypothetical protein
MHYLGFSSLAHARRSLLYLRRASMPILLTHGALVLIVMAAVHLCHRWCRYRFHPRSVFVTDMRQLRWTTSSSVCSWVGVTCDKCNSHGRQHAPAGHHHCLRYLITHAWLAAAPTRALPPVPPRGQELPHGRSIRYYLSLLFFSQ